MSIQETTTKFKADISQLKKAMQEASRAVAVANSEFKVAASSCDDWSKESIGLEAKMKQLGTTLSSQKTILSNLEQQYELTVQHMGKGSKAAQDLEIKINNQKAAINKTEKEIRQYSGELSKVSQAEKEAARSGKTVAEVLEDVGKSADGAADGAKGAGDGFTLMKGAVASFVGGGLTALASGLKDALVNLVALADETREYREDMAKLDAAFTSAGHTTETANKIYEDFYKLLGESDRSVEAVNHLAELTDRTEDLSKWQTIAAGVTAKFGDSLPLEGLTEAANETAKVGKVTGPLADAINWVTLSTEEWTSTMGGNQKAMKAFEKAVKESEATEDAYSAALAAMNSEQERATAMTNLLSKAYAGAAAEYNELTAGTQAAREATMRMEQAQARLGAAMEPVANWFTNLKAGAIEFGATLVEGVNPSLSSSTNEFRYLNAEQEKTIKNAFEAAENLREMKAASDESAVSIATNMNYTKSLADELMRLCDETGKVQDVDKDRAAFILGELNSALGTEYAMTGNVVNGYNDIKDSIELVIATKRAQIILAEYEDDYAEAVSNVAKQEQARATQAIAVSEAEQALAEKEAELANSSGMMAVQIAKSVDARKAKLEEEREKYKELDASVKESHAAISSYEQAKTAILKGETDEGINILNEYGNSFLKAAGDVSDAAKTELEVLHDKVINTSVQLALLEDEYAKKQANMTAAEKTEMENRIANAKQQAQDARAEYAAVGGSMVEGMVEGVQNKDGTTTWNLGTVMNGIVSSAVDAVKRVWGINSPSKKTRDKLGKPLPQGMAVGIKEDGDLVSKAMVDVLEDTMDAGQKAMDIHSPAGVPREKIGKPIVQGIAQGIIKTADEAIEALENLGDDLIESQEFYFAEKERIEKEDYEREKAERLASAKDAKELEKIKQEYVEKEAEEARKAYLDDLKEAADAERKEYDALLSDLKKKFEEIKKAQEGFSKKLFDDTTKTVMKVKDFLGDGNQEIIKLSNSTYQIQGLLAYSDLLDSVIAKRGTLPEDIRELLSGMDAEEGMEYMKAMLSATDEEWERYVSGFDKRRTLTDKIASVLFPKEALSEEASNFLGEARAEMKETAEEIQGEFTDVILEDFKATIKASVWELNQAKQYLSETLSGALNGMKGEASASKTWSVEKNSGVVNNFYQTVNSPKPLNNLEIYRQSKNLLNYKGGAT